MASWEATGPPGTTCEPPATVVIVVGSVRFWMTPPRSSTTAATAATGSSTRTTARTRSTQKLPIVATDERARPRTSAIATARPTAGETKFWTVSPTVCTRGDTPDSPAYDCQLVLVTKETAVLRAVSTSIAAPRARGSVPWATMNANSSDDADEREAEDGRGIRRPALLGGRVDAAQAVGEALEAPVPRVGEDPRQPRAQGHVDGGEGRDEDSDGEQAAGGLAHQKRSACSST